MSTIDVRRIAWVYSSHAQATQFHLPATNQRRRLSRGGTQGVATRCGERIIRAVTSVADPDHLDLCDECVLPDVLKPSVYRFFGADGELLYVGCTGNVVERFRRHGSPYSPSVAWWPRQRRHTITTYATKKMAFAAERAAIAAERPEYPQPRRKPARRRVAA